MTVQGRIMKPNRLKSLHLTREALLPSGVSELRIFEQMSQK